MARIIIIVNLISSFSNSIRFRKRIFSIIRSQVICSSSSPPPKKKKVICTSDPSYLNGDLKLFGCHLQYLKSTSFIYIWMVTKNKRLFGCKFFITQFSLLITHHSSLYPTLLAPLLTCHHSIFFTLFVGFKAVTRCSFFFSQYPNSLNPMKKKKN